MAWEVILWIIFFVINVALIASNLYQKLGIGHFFIYAIWLIESLNRQENGTTELILIDNIHWPLYYSVNYLGIYQIACLSDLEADYMNPYETSSRINAVVLPEFLLHVVCSALLLVMGYWFMFLLTLPITIHNSMLYMNRQHLIDVTEVFRNVDAEKKYRIAKLAVYLCLFILVVIRSVVAGKFSNILEPFHPTNEDLDILSHVLEF